METSGWKAAPCLLAKSQNFTSRIAHFLGKDVVLEKMHSAGKKSNWDSCSQKQEQRQRGLWSGLWSLSQLQTRKTHGFFSKSRIPNASCPEEIKRTTTAKGKRRKPPPFCLRCNTVRVSKSFASQPADRKDKFISLSYIFSSFNMWNFSAWKTTLGEGVLEDLKWISLPENNAKTLLSPLYSFLLPSPLFSFITSLPSFTVL